MELSKIVTKLEKSKIKAGDGKKVGKYPLYTCSPIVDKFYDKYLYDTKAIILSTGGNPVINYYDGKFAYSTDCLVIKTNDELEEKYMYYYLISKIDNISKMFRGVGIKHLNKNEFFKLEITLIDKNKQKEIITNLDKVNKIIELKKEQLKEYDNIMKSQFVEMFGDPNIVKSNEKTELKTIMINANNGMARRGNDSDGSIVLRLVELQRNYIDYSNVNKIILKDNEKKKYLLEEGDILFARVNGNPDSVGRCAYYKDIGKEVYHNDHIIRVKFDLHKINPIYLCTLLNDEYGRKEFKNKIKTSAGQYTISQDGIEKVKIPLPPIELQNKFAEFVNEIDKQKFEIENSLKEMQELYESLMEKYFG